MNVVGGFTQLGISYIRIVIASENVSFAAFHFSMIYFPSFFPA